ncbi:MAG TPA: saccharopine dehydrogenase NADP-binding domain-containing protein [Candidatus Limnocylindrales bacterium]|nr:saccharopine dehydrogenase NADP-binding domain-containing protein [Candidatus Limnocylindrales bacterium]
MDRLLVLGATGYTGRLVVSALERLEQPYVLGGRNRVALEEMAAALPSRPDVRVADAGDGASVAQALGGMRAVINTVGPFTMLGMPVVRAAVDMGVHYVDTTGEQTFQMQVYESLHRRAVSTGATVITGAAFEYTFSYLGAALLHERCGPLLTVSSYHFTDGFRPSTGTALSALGMIGERFVAFRDGRLAPMPTSWTARRVMFPGERDPFWAAPFPGGDAVMLPLDIASLQSASCYVLLPRAAAAGLALATKAQPAARRMMGDRMRRLAARGIARWMAPPPPGERENASWIVFVHAQSPSGSHLCRMSGADVYATSGATAALTATWLVRGRGRDAGVMTTGKALPAMDMLDALRTFGVRWELR